MADLVFATRGQSEVLKAQEEIAKKSREIRDEFMEGAKATGKWDAATAKLQRTSEAALRSVATEQEKIADKIALIQERQEKGIGTTEENEAAIKRLRERWVELDDATVKQREEAVKVAQAHEQLKIKATNSLRSVQSEEELVAARMRDIQDEIDAVGKAMEAGLIPPDEAEEGIKRLKKRMEDLGESVSVTSKSIVDSLNKAFAPEHVIKFATKFVGVGAAIKTLQAAVNDEQIKIRFTAEVQEKRYQQINERLAALAKKGSEGGITAQEDAEMYRLLEERKRLQPRISTSQALGNSAQRFALRGSTDVLSAADVDRLEDALRYGGQGGIPTPFDLGSNYVQRRIDLASVGHGGTTRDEGIQLIEAQMERLTQMMEQFFRSNESRQLMQEQLAELRNVAQELRGIANKDGTILYGVE